MSFPEPPEHPDAKVLTDDGSLKICPPESLKKGVVSVLVPCYNVTRYLGRFIDCLIAQTYKKLEILFADDGSSDGTLEMILARLPELEAQGYRVKVLSHANRGVAPTVNRLLKYFTGEFLCWADPDDTYDPDALDERLRHLTENPQEGGVMSQCRLFRQHADRVTELIFNAKKIESYHGDFAWPLVRRELSPFPIVYMLRSAAFLETVPDREIYHDAVGGQNFQIIMPVFLRYKIGFLPEPNCTYYRYDDSHSRRRNSFEGYRHMAEAAARLVDETLKRYPGTEALRQEAQTRRAEGTFRDAFRYWRFIPAWRAALEMRHAKRLRFKHLLKLFLLLFLGPFRSFR